MPPTMSNIPNTRFQTSIIYSLHQTPGESRWRGFAIFAYCLLPTVNCDCDCKLKNYFVTYTQPTNGSGKPGSLSSIT